MKFKFIVTVPVGTPVDLHVGRVIMVNDKECKILDIKPMTNEYELILETEHEEAAY